MSAQNRKSFDWAFWFLWIMATAWGWILGSLFAPGISVVATGIATGAMQWLLLKPRMARAWRWIVATAAGWTAGGLLGSYLLPEELSLLAATLVGATTGAAQWLVLRRRVQWAGWWPAVSGVAWAAGLTLFPAPLLVGVIPGAITGLALEVLLHFAARPDTIQGPSQTT